LNVFAKLAQGREIAKDRSLPHIIADSPYAVQRKKKENTNDQPERCWKALLLPQEVLPFRNEWELVREHFDKSRSKKVLSIIQQK
jgi:hypothetical protein